MRLLEYSKMLGLIDSLKEAFEYMDNSKTLSLLENCEEAMNEINRRLMSNPESLKNENVLETASQLITEIRDCTEASFEYEKIISLLNQFRECCETGIERKYKLLFACALLLTPTAHIVLSSKIPVGVNPTSF